MSTAGKVLVVLVMLSAILCLMLAGGIAQLNYNGTKKLDDLSKELVKTQENLEKTRHEISNLSDHTIVVQEKIDRDVMALRVQQNDLERSHSQISYTLDRVKHELETVNTTIQGAQTSIENRKNEFDAEEKAMDDLRRQVLSLKSTNTQLMDRLKTLRDQFQHSYHENVGMLSKRQ
jgi:chromosome segregation ATPase